MRSSQRRLTRAAVAVVVVATVLVVPADGQPGSTVMEAFGAGAAPAAADSDDHGRVSGGLGPGHTSWDNPCTGVPDEAILPIPSISWGWWPPWPRVVIRDYLIFDAAHACSHHDDCYIYKSVHTRSGQVSVARDENGRARCDSQFHDDLYEACDHHSDAVWACEMVADYYYIGVRGFGGESWENSSPCTSWRGVMNPLIARLSNLVGEPGFAATGEAGLLARVLADFFSHLLSGGHPNVDRCEP